MLEIKLGRLKHDTGYREPVELAAVCDTVAYGYPELHLAAPLEFLGQAENFAGEIQVAGQLTALITLACSCCCTSFVQKLILPFAETYSGQPAAPDADGEMDKHPFSGDSIDITPEALRLLFPELPMKPVCQEDCRGLCPVCGADLNHQTCSCARDVIDPRWEALRALLPPDE